MQHTAAYNATLDFLQPTHCSLQCNTRLLTAKILLLTMQHSVSYSQDTAAYNATLDFLQPKMLLLACKMLLHANSMQAHTNIRITEDSATACPWQSLLLFPEVQMADFLYKTVPALHAYYSIFISSSYSGVSLYDAESAGAEYFTVRF